MKYQEIAARLRLLAEREAHPVPESYNTPEELIGGLREIADELAPVPVEHCPHGCGELHCYVDPQGCEGTHRFREACVFCAARSVEA